MAHQPEPRLLGLQAAEGGQRRVGRAVIDVDDLEGCQGLAGMADLGHQGLDVAGLVLHRHHHAEARRPKDRIYGLGRRAHGVEPGSAA
jgi:hypothetical protein